MKTITKSELGRLAFCNSSKLPRAVNINGTRYEWVGIGWINTGKPNGKETKVVDRKKK